MPYIPDEWEDLPSLKTPIIAAKLRKLGAQYATLVADLNGPVGEQLIADLIDTPNPAYDAIRALIVEVISELAGTGDPRSPIGFDPVTNNPVLLIERPA
jgi:hypothetical protein